MLAGHLSDLRALSRITLEEYRANKILRGYVERTLQVSIQICLDIGSRLIAEFAFRQPDDSRDVFAVLAEEGILPPELLASLQKMAGFRNLIVHDYARIDDSLVFAVLQSRLVDFEQFAGVVAEFIEQVAGSPPGRE